MELSAVYRCVTALDVHQAKLTVCVLTENDLGEVVTQLREFGGFKQDLRAMAAWVASFQPELVVMESTGILLEKPLCGLGVAWFEIGCGQRPPCQTSARPQNRYQ